MTSMLFRILRTCDSLLKRNYIKNEKLSLNFLFNLWSLHQLLNIFLKKKIVMAIVFPKLQTVKDLVRPFSKKCSFRTSFDSQHVKQSQTLVKSAWEHFDHLFSWVWGKMSWKTSALYKFELIGVLVNTLTPDYKYPVLHSDNLPFPIQMRLSENWKPFSQFFCSIYGIYIKF